MERNVSEYCGSEINEYCIDKFKCIKKSVISKKSFDNYYNYLNNINELALSYDFRIDQIRLILGEDWTLLYAIENEYIYLLEWARINNIKTKYIQSIEMFNSLKCLLMDNNEKFFCANMKHTTSYKFYSKMLNDEYFEEIKNNLYDTYRLIKGFNIIKLEFAKYQKSVDYLLDSGTILNENELSKIFHFVVFKVTDKFINKYSNVRLLKKH